MYREKIEQVQKSTFSFVNDAMMEANSSGSTQNLPMGWALKTRAQQKRMTEDQRSYLVDKFNEGQRTGNKHEPEEVAKAMRRAKNLSHDPRFMPVDYLKPFQIKAFFSRMSAKTKKGIIATPDVEETDEIPEVPEEDPIGPDYQLEELLLSTHADLLD